MLKRVLAGLRGARAEPKGVPGSARLPPGHRIYAIGDVHGRVDLLRRMRELIEADLARSAPEQALVVLLGDYVDRGAHSRAVLDLLISEPFPAPSLPLCGNHEAMLLDFLQHPESGDTWRRFGGIETVHSYGVDVSEFRLGQGLAATSERLRLAIPSEHKTFLEHLALTHSAGGYFFCHAGVRPGVPLHQQRREDLLWIRDEFMRSSEPLGAVIVHGHTPSEQPMVRENAIGVDTGAYITGRLTCAVLSSNSVDFLAT